MSARWKKALLAGTLVVNFTCEVGRVMVCSYLVKPQARHVLHTQ